MLFSIGGPNTLETVVSSVENGSPCVFIEVKISIINQYNFKSFMHSLKLVFLGYVIYIYLGRLKHN
jgi:hypothetical protein